MTDTRDPLFGGGGGAPAVKFESIGDTVTGTITKYELKQARSYEDNKPLYWPAEPGEVPRPKLEPVLTIATALRDSFDDDGERRLFFRGASYLALRDEVWRNKLDTVELGWTITMTFAGLGEQKDSRKKRPKLFTINLTPPADPAFARRAVPVPQLAHDTAPAAAAPAPVAAPVAAPAVPTTAATVPTIGTNPAPAATPDLAAELAGLGATPEQLAALGIK